MNRHDENDEQKAPEQKADRHPVRLCLLVVTAKGISELAHRQVGTQPGGYTMHTSEPWVQGFTNRSGSSDEFNRMPGSSDGFSNTQDSSDGFFPDAGYAAGMNPSINAEPLTGSDMGDDAVTQGYWDRQADQDRTIQGIDNEIKDQVTLENPDTGEQMQADAGSNTYYQSPSVDSEMGQSTIVGTDGGSSLPADATQLNVVGVDTSSTSSSSGTVEP